jgi:Transposase DDE domain.
MLTTANDGLKKQDLKGLKYFKALRKALKRLHPVGTERDRARNRKLFYDDYVSLLLIYFFNPTITSLRGIQKASGLKEVQRLLKCSRASLSSLSEAVHVFDPKKVRQIMVELASHAQRTGRPVPKELEKLLVADGTLLPALSKMAWALWLDEDHRAAKVHLVFEVLSWTPQKATVTAGNGSEKNELRKMLQSGRLYVMDRGYAEYALFQDIISAKSSFICRIRDNAVSRVVEERPLTAEAKAAGVRSDRVVWLGCEKSGAALKQQIRVIEVDVGKKDAQGNPDLWILATDRLDLPAELVVLGYHYRWSIELFFRWFKCILGCRHLLSQSQEGVQIQAYVALIASLLISLWTGRKPTKRTFEMLCFFFTGWANERELLAHIAQLEEHGQ